MRFYIFASVLHVSHGHWCFGWSYSDCGDCPETACKEAGNIILDEDNCHWDNESRTCVTGRDIRGQRQRVDCGLSNTASHCGGCGGGETLCGGECHWLEQANFCVHIEVHMAPPFMSLSSSGPTGKKFPGAMGVYSLSQISNVSHLLVGYSLLHDTNNTVDQEPDDFYIFKDYKDQSTEFVSRVPFSTDEEDLILFYNVTGWFMKYQRFNGRTEFVKDPTVTLAAMESTEEHDCKFSEWEEGPCSSSCGGGVKVLTREMLRDARGHGVCAETRRESPCNSQPCDEDCQWSDWEEQTACSRSCGGGDQTITRNIVRNVSGHGQPCTGEAIRQRSCNDNLCPEVVAAIVIPTSLFILAVTFITVNYCRGSYSLK